MSLLRILIVDDQESFRRGVRLLVSPHSAWSVCGEAQDGIQAVESAKALRPDVVVMDVSMPRMNGLDATRAIRQELPEAKVIIVSQNDPRVVGQQAAAVQAHGYIAKADLSRDLISTIERVLESDPTQDRPSFPDGSVSAPSSNRSQGMAALVASKNWKETPIGAAETWSPTLRTITNFLLANRFPLLLWWGSDYIQIYNDAYVPVLGVKHPRALGQPVRECWNEIWHILKPLIDTPYHGGPATWLEDLEVEIQRSGKIEETHFTVAYSPVPDDIAPNGIGGVLATVHEISEKVVGERRVAILRDLGAGAGEAKTAEQACTIAAEVFTKYPKDFPFTLLYLNDPDGRHARLVCCTDIAQGEPGAPFVIELHEDFSTDSTWALSQVKHTLNTVVVTGLSDHFEGKVPRGVWSQPPSEAAVIPVRSSQASHLAGFLIVGISAGLRCDEAYLSFLDLAARQIATSIANARAYEEERKRAEALAEIDRAKTIFFSNVSHEFRTPLTLMLGPLHDLLARSQTHLSPIAKEQLELVNRNGDRLLRLVNTLLDFSRIEAGRVEAVYQATDLGAFTGELASVFRSATDRAGLRLLVDCHDLGEPVYIDRDMWEKIVLNLVSNAFKFTFEGEIEVSVRRVEGAAEMRVRDTGVGIPPEAIPRLFERFHRVANTRSRTHEGSGIGLALVQQLVKLHGGLIQVESTVGTGTTFIVRIPFGQSHLTAGRVRGSRSLAATGVGATPFIEEALRWLPDTTQTNGQLFESGELLPFSCPPTSNSASRFRILVADDNSDMRQYLARLLSEHYDVETVADGQSAINAARERPPSLILSDVMMPLLDGFDLLKAVKEDERTRHIPVVLLSARAGEESRVEGLRAGADDYLIKPFSARELLARVGARLEIAYLQQQREKAAAADLAAMTCLHDLGYQYIRTGNDVEGCLQATVDVAIFLAGAEKGNLQTLDSTNHSLKIVAQSGFEQPFLKHFANVTSEDCACGSAMASLKQVVIADINRSDIFSEKRSLQVLRDAGVRAVTSTPLLSSTGKLLGMVSTHFTETHQPSDHDLRLLDLLARQCADYLERRQAEENLHQRTAQFETLLNEAPMGVFLIGADFRILDVNPIARPAFGNIPDLIGRDFDEVMHILWTKEYADEVVAIYRHTLETGEPFYTAERAEHRIDRNITEYYEWSINRIPLPNGDSGVVCYFRDISSQVNARLKIAESEKQLATEAAELLKLNNLSSRLWRIETLEQGFSEIVNATIELLGGEKATLQILDERHSVLTIVAQRGFEKEFLKFFEQVAAHDDSACGRTLRFGLPLVIEDVEADPPFAPLLPVVRAAGYRAVVCTPLKDMTGSVLGVLSVHFSQPHRPTEESLRRLELYSRQAADFISRWKVESALREKEQEQRLLAEISDMSLTGHAAQELTLATAKMIAQHFNVSRCGMSRVDIPSGTLTVAQDFSAELPSLAGTYPMEGYAGYYFDQATAGVATAVEDVQADPRTSKVYDKLYAPIGVRSFLTIPLHRDANWVGNFWVSHHEPRFWKKEEITFFKGVADRIWVGIENARVSEELRRSESELRTSQARLEQTVQERTKELIHASQELRELSAQILQAQDEERRRIARELHDGAGQLVAALSMEIANIAAERQKLGSDAAASVSSIESLIAQMNVDIRTMSHLLYPPLLDEVGLRSALLEYVKGFSQRSGINVSLDMPQQLQRLERDLELCLFRVIQECLTNIHRHSASKVAEIRIARKDATLNLNVTDHGKGIPKQKLSQLHFGGSGVGIRGMRERVRKFSGNLTIDSGDSGTRVKVVIPIPEVSEAIGEESSAELKLGGSSKRNP